MSLTQLASVDRAAVRPLEPADRPRANPCHVYLASLARGSRRAAGQALRVVAGILPFAASPEDVPWHLVRYEDTAAVRAGLLERGYAPGTANRILTALRGVLHATFSLGLMSGEALVRAADVKAVRGSRAPRGRAVSHVEVERLFMAAGDGGTAAGARNAVVLGLLFGAGLRRAEVVGLDLASYDDGAEVLRILGKGNHLYRDD